MTDQAWQKIIDCFEDSLTVAKEVTPVVAAKVPKSTEVLNIVIDRRGTYVVLDSLSAETIKRLKNLLTLKHKTVLGGLVQRKLYSMVAAQPFTQAETRLKGTAPVAKLPKNLKIVRPRSLSAPKEAPKEAKVLDTSTKLFIPRFAAFLLHKKFSVNIENRIVPCNPVLTLDYHGEFIGNQELVFDEITEKFFSEESMLAGQAGLILNLEAGQGKTFLALALIGHLKCRTLIVVHNTTIMKQWKKLVAEYLPGSSVGEYYGVYKCFGDVNIAIVNSLMCSDPMFSLGMSIYDYYGSMDFVIFDEAHEYCSQERAKVFELCQAPYMLGLSATPEDRTVDEWDKVPKWNLGPVLVAAKLDDYTEDSVDFKGRVTMIKYKGPTEFTKHIVCEKTDMAFIPFMIQQACDDPYRTKLVIALILELYVKKYNVFVFADRREYLTSLDNELKKVQALSTIVTEDKTFEALCSSRLVGGVSEDAMIDAEENNNIILTTYLYLGTGKSIPKMNAIVLATPRKTKSRQFINRIFRLGSDISIERQIYDIVDWKTILKNQWYVRLKYYREKGYPVDVRDVSYLDF